LPRIADDAAAYQAAGERQTKKNAAKAAFFSIYPDHPGAKAHLDYCR
jgi:hypothetical protein